MLDSDQDIVRRVLEGEKEAYAELIRRHHPKVLGVCVSILLDLTRAEDAAQDVFIKAYRSLASFQGRSAFPTWLYRIATNHCLDIKRNLAREKTESWEALLERESEPRDLPSAPGPEESLEKADLINRVLGHLSERARAVLLLRETMGLSYEEIAEVLACSVDAVKSRLKRARQEARDAWGHFFASKTSNQPGVDPHGR